LVLLQYKFLQQISGKGYSANHQI